MTEHYGHFDPYALDSAPHPITGERWAGYYCRHVSALTEENLHSKAEIAAELGWRDLQIDTLRAELAACAAALPGVYYMDSPDGGDVPMSEQLRRMAKDAERYRLLRRKFAIISDGEGHAEFCAINLPHPTYIAPSSAIELDTALDRERLGLDGARPSTPVGWSDTDWIRHLQEQGEPHPLAGQHINQGSLDAAADAYEAEYNEAQEARRVEKLRKLGARLAELLDEDQFAECEALLLAAGVMPEENESLRATISRLREYAKHKRECWSFVRGGHDCDCGYDALMADVEESK